MCEIEKNISIEKANLYSQIVIAMANFALAVYAVFGESIRRYVKRPKISISIEENFPYLEEVSEKSQEESDKENKSFVIRIKIENKGKNPATNLRVISDKIYKERDSNKKFILGNQFLPQQYYFLDGSQTQDIIANFPYYVAISKIARSQMHAEYDKLNNNEKEKNELLFLLIDKQNKKGSFHILGRGRFVIPIYVYFLESKIPEEIFLEIFWNANRLENKNQDTFSISKISKSDFLKRKDKGVS
ncbi:hypothetical protein [Leptospira meyeri]|uniref:hypothetical protein n=1 Tax=Leptospira meyeri TaxID=29508 RepID=UPI0002BFB632|nr:hypothetical protein [Leptospira meyeri]EMJ87270.1 hypothetical protein LEP1GSC196_2952 [Leptospira meyeri serovar Semaranga str. Veldrot Semarang 173]